MATIRELLGDNYKDGMTFEEVETALSSMKLADLSKGEYVSKGKMTDIEARAKKAEDELRKRMTDDEIRQQEIAERENHYKQIERENTIYKYKNDLSSSIKDSAVVNEIATLFADGNYADAIKKQSEYFAKDRATLEAQIRDELLRKNPEPAPQKEEPTKKAKDYTMTEWNKLLEENPAEYKRLLGTIK